MYQESACDLNKTWYKTMVEKLCPVPSAQCPVPSDEGLQSQYSSTALWLWKIQFLLLDSSKKKRRINWYWIILFFNLDYLVSVFTSLQFCNRSRKFSFCYAMRMISNILISCQIFPKQKNWRTNNFLRGEKTNQFAMISLSIESF